VAQEETAAAVTRGVLTGAVCVVVGYLAFMAAFPHNFHAMGWFGRVQRPWSTMTVGIVVVLIAVVCVLSYRRQISERPGAFPVATIALLAVTSAVLAFASFARCSDDMHPPLFTAIMWAAGTVKGNIADYQLSGSITCPAVTPVALQVARVAGMSAIYLGVISGAVALLTTQLDRARVRYARRVTAIVDVDNDSRSMVPAVARALDKSSRLAVIVPAGSLPDAPDLRRQGARIIGIDLSQLDVLASLPIWTKLDKLYLLSASPSANLLRLKAINQHISPDTARRLPLVVRIDDPWQAESWRNQQLGRSDTRWIADSVSINEVTAARLLGRIEGTGQITKIIVCGGSPLTLALCANLVRQRLERDYYAPPGSPPLPSLTIVGTKAEEYRQDHEIHQQQLGLPPTDTWLDAVTSPPSMATLEPMITAAVRARTCTAAVVFATTPEGAGADAMLGTRLAARFPTLPIFVLDPKRPESTDGDVAPIIGALRTFALAMDTQPDEAQDVFERAAMLIHERYRPKTGPPANEASKPWATLNDFYRGSNRRLVQNAFAMVEQIAGHTWDSFGAVPGPPTPVDPDVTNPVERALARLRAIGFDRDAAMAMAEAEHNNWSDYLRSWGWRLAPAGQTKRDEEKKTRPDLVPWSKIIDDEEALGRSLTNLADTFYTLRQLGYRSRPQWQRFRRIGDVTAEQRDEPWSWTTESGDVQQAAAGDWEVTDGDGLSWSVRDDIFRSTYEPVSDKRWRRTGVVRARPARDGEAIEALEGPEVATESDWVITGTKGEQWLVPGEKFARRYQLEDSSALATD
jgi:hypothetical protein